VHNLIQGRSLISTPFAVYGGVCASDEEAGNALRVAACEMAREDKVQYLELRERWPRTDAGFLTKQLYVTFDQELPQDSDSLLKGFPRDTRYMIRKGQKSGLRVVLDNQQLDAFWEIYAHSVHHLGTPVFSKTFFQTLLEEFGHQSEISAVWNGEQCIAAVLSFRFRDWILPYYGGSLHEGRRLAANNFMYWEVMRRALEQGARYFDFGRSKIGTGSYAFKTQWNMRERPLPYLFYLVGRKSMPNYSPLNPRFRVPISLWKGMPFFLTKKLGPIAVRLFP
jgi:FemAB-related protein (PEP-CTERM system-associated)